MHSLSYDIVRCTAWRSISRYRVIDIGPNNHEVLIHQLAFQIWFCVRIANSAVQELCPRMAGRLSYSSSLQGKRREDLVCVFVADTGEKLSLDRGAGLLL